MNDAPLRGHIIIAGVGKSGTTSLFEYLGRHPEICPASVKETHFFTPLRTGGTLPPMTRYDAYFHHQGDERYRLEASPDYCVGGTAVRQAIRRELEAPHVVIVLRDPVARLHDNFWYMKGKLRLSEFEDFDSYVRARLAARSEGHDADPMASHTGWVRSFYGDYLGAWLDEFGDALRLVFFEDLVRDPKTVVAELFTWLGLDPGPGLEGGFGNHNPTRTHRSRTLQRAVVGISRRSQRFLTRHPRVRQRLRRSYFAVNSRPSQSPAITPETRAQLEAALRPSLSVLAEVLVAHGYSHPPDWVPRSDDLSWPLP